MRTRINNNVYRGAMEDERKSKRKQKEEDKKDEEEMRLLDACVIHSTSLLGHHWALYDIAVPECLPSYLGIC